MITHLNANSLPAMRKMKNGQFKLAIVDPPWGHKADYVRTGRHTGKLAYLNKPYSNEVFKQPPPPREYFRQLFRVSQHQIIWGINYFEAIYKLPIGPGRIIWDKCNPGTDYSDCEVAYCSLINSVRLLRFMWNGMMQGKSITEGHIKRGDTRLNEKRYHPCQKPTPLYAWLLDTFAKPGWTILDTHGGSAAHDLNFDLTIYEIDKTYYADAARDFAVYRRQHRIDFTPVQPQQLSLLE